MALPDQTHDPALTSWVNDANGHQDFPIQNLPLGIFAPKNGVSRVCVAIGDHILDLHAASTDGVFADEFAESLVAATLNPWLSLPQKSRARFRTRLSELLAAGSADRSRLELHLQHAADTDLRLPAVIGDYTDFFAGLHHATNVGRIAGSDNPLSPNYKYAPLAYHGRASSVRPSGIPVTRPHGQFKPRGADAPVFGPSRRLDYEVELGLWIGGPDNQLGAQVPINEAGDRIAGVCLLNDWSARDIQGWESHPSGPFLGKSFHTTVSPWVVTSEALSPFRIPQPPRPDGDPRPLPYLWDDSDQAGGAYNIMLESFICTPDMRRARIAPHRLSICPASNLYWTPAQLVTHHAVNGCNLVSGDLIGTGTISTPTPEGFGSLLEITEGNRKAVILPTGEERRFLEDGDEIILKARAQTSGRISIGFGECRGRIVSA